MLRLQPISLKEAQIFVEEHHRHHGAPVGHKYSIAARDGEQLVGVVMCGRPVGRHSDDGWTIEVLRCCTDGTKNACSFLYAAAWRAAKALGYKRMITYTLPEEGGASLRAAGWQVLYTTKAEGYWTSRPRLVKHPTGQKLLWEAPSNAL